MFQIALEPVKSHVVDSSRRPLLSFAIALALSGCGGGTVSLGEEEVAIEEPPPVYSTCQFDGPLAGEIVVKNQAELDALEGCPVIDGDLFIVAFEGADLRPLGALTTIEGFLQIGTDPHEVDGAAVAQIEELIDNGWLESLEGLESLERVAGMTVSGLSAPTLAPLANLRALTDGGFLSLDHCPGLRDLSGLENLRGVSSLAFNCENLESIAALRLPRHMSSLSLQGPTLSDLGSLEVEWISGELSIGGTAFENLDAFASLRSVEGGLVIENNPLLSDVSGLSNLELVGTLIVRGNDALAQLSEFESLERLDALLIEGNANLVALPEFPSLLADLSGLGLTERDLLHFRPDLIEIFGNPKLESIAIPEGWRSGAYVLIADNERLSSLDFQRVTAIDRLIIESNPVLAGVNLGALSRVATLNVIDNPLLSPAQFDAVQSFERQMSGNAP